MTNSPMVCQKYVAQVVDPFRIRYPDIYLIHYMDDIFLPGPHEHALYQITQKLIAALQHQGLQISPEKVQMHPLLRVRVIS